MGLEAHRPRSGPCRQRYSDDWHREHLVDPRRVVPESIMPGYPVPAADADLGAKDIADHLRANHDRWCSLYRRNDRQCRQADIVAQANADGEGVEDFPEALSQRPQARDFDGQPGKLTEMDALVAYLQMLGTLVDFNRPTKPKRESEVTT